MNPITEPTLNIQDIPRIFSKYWSGILLTTIFSTVLFTIASFYVPKKYKAHFVLTIYSKYFQSPLIGDFVPELSESGEMRSQRESLIRQVLTPAYLDALGNKYGIYGSPKDATNLMQELIVRFRKMLAKIGLLEDDSAESQLSAEREALRSRFEIYSQNTTTYNVAFVYSDRDVTVRVISDLHAEVIQSLLDLRLRTLVNLRDAIQKRMPSAPNSTPAAGDESDIPGGAHMAADELAEVRKQIDVLSAEYTDEHPLLMQLRDRERILQSRLQNVSPRYASRSSRTGKGFGAGGSKDSGPDIYGDLQKKLNYLNIAIDSDQQHQADYFATLEPPLYPSSPVWPKKGLFTMWGLAFGFCGSLFLAALKEYFKQSTLHVEVVAQQLGLPLLGKLPPFPSKVPGQ